MPIFSCCRLIGFVFASSLAGTVLAQSLGGMGQSAFGTGSFGQMGANSSSLQSGFGGSGTSGTGATAGVGGIGSADPFGGIERTGSIGATARTGSSFSSSSLVAPSSAGLGSQNGMGLLGSVGGGTAGLSGGSFGGVGGTGLGGFGGGLGGFGGGLGGIGGLGGFGNAFGGGNQSNPPIRTRLRNGVVATPRPTGVVNQNANNRLNDPVVRGRVGDNVRAAVRNETVTLSGTVADPRERRMSELLMRLEPGVRNVDNQIRVAP